MMNKPDSKKRLAVAIIGICIVSGAAAFSVYAADTPSNSNPPPAALQERPPEAPPNPAKMAEFVEKKYGISQADMQKYLAQGYNAHDVGKAAFLAKVSGKSLADVIALKKPYNTWKEVMTTLGVTREQIKTVRQNEMAEHLSARIGLTKNATLDLLKQGYHPQDISSAAVLAKNSTKPVTDILALKKINNTWSDVAAELGVSPDVLKNAHGQMHHPHGPGFGEPGPEGGSGSECAPGSDCGPSK